MDRIIPPLKQRTHLQCPSNPRHVFLYYAKPSSGDILKHLMLKKMQTQKDISYQHNMAGSVKINTNTPTNPMWKF
jgi:hypothetical protein